MNTNLLKEAIADAEAIKQLAIDNAKASLNEAFDSKIKSMLAAKLEEASDDPELKDLEEDMEEGEGMKSKDEGKHSEEEKKGEDKGEEQDESFDIDAILAEMEEEGMKSKDEGKHSEEEGEEPAEEPAEKPAEEPAKEPEGNMEEEIDLEALIAEMSKEEEQGAYGKEEQDEAYEEEYELEEGDDPHTALIEKFKKFLKSQKPAKEPAEEPAEETKKESVELQEIKRQAAELAQKVNETNLINAKLLYLNKVLRNHNLSEQQKLKVVAAFDKASSVKEAKIVYESINEALNIKVQNTKTTLKESLGFASKASGTSTKREIITEADDHVARWQKLAGIKK